MEGDLEIMREAASALEAGNSVVLCTVVEKKGSAPRDAGAKLLVTMDKVVGTLGGGEFERLVINHAREALRKGNSRLVRYAFHGEAPGAEIVSTGHLCGGEASVFFDVLKPSRRMILIGAGNVSIAFSRFAQVLGFRIWILDDNPDVATKERFPMAEKILIGNLAEMLEEINPMKEDLILIAHGNSEKEYEVLKLLTGLEVRYIGLLGSRNKGANLLKRLKDEGYSLNKLVGVLHVPVGLDIGSDTPEEIAASIIAEIIAKLKGAKVSSLSVADEIIEKLEEGVG